MSELDRLRRVAYGRTSTPDEEAAAADARAALERHDADERQARAEREAATVAPNGDTATAADGANTANSSDYDRVTLTLVDPDDEPGFPRKFVSSWRVWAVPAFAAFVIGIVLTVASGLFILRGAYTAPVEIVTSGSQVGAPALVPGDLAHASQLLAREQKPDDIPTLLDESIDSTTTHLLRAGKPNSVFAAMSVEGNICLIVIWPDLDSSGTACSPPSEFAVRGLLLGSSIDDETAQVQWDGRTLTETASTR